MPLKIMSPKEIYIRKKYTSISNDLKSGKSLQEVFEDPDYEFNTQNITILDIKQLCAKTLNPNLRTSCIFLICKLIAE